jgi:hypothetical protein
MAACRDAPLPFCRRSWAGLLAAGLLAVGGPCAAEPAVATAEAAGVRLTLTLDRDRLLIDDRARLSLRVEGPRDLVLGLPQAPERLGALAVIGHERPPPRPAGEAGMVWEEVLVLQPEAVGELVLPEIAITFRPAGAAAEERLAARPPPVTVASVLPAAADLTRPRDIGPPVELPPAGLAPAVWLAGFLAAGLGLAAALFRRRRGARPARSVAIGHEPAMAGALAELEALERADLIAAGRITEFYHRLAEILRRHTQELMAVDGSAWTTEELLAGVTGRGGVLAACRDLLESLLADCDRVKFARHRPTGAAARRTAAHARAFIERTGAVSGPAAPREGGAGG